MAKKSNSNFSQASLFGPTEEELAAATKANSEVQSSFMSETPGPDLNEQKKQILSETKCPKCGAKAAKSVKGGEFLGIWYCTGACSYGDNFYFTPGGDSATSAPTSK